MKVALIPPSLSPHLCLLGRGQTHGVSECLPLLSSGFLGPTTRLTNAGLSIGLYPSPTSPSSHLHSLAQGCQIAGRGSSVRGLVVEGNGVQSRMAAGSGVQPGPSPGVSLALPEENQLCSTFKFETCQWARSLPHQSPGKWWGSRVGGERGWVGRRRGNSAP